MKRSERLSGVGRAPDLDAWTAIVHRRPAPAASPWYLVVTSTGIVCRPGCPARTPRRENVRIVDRLDEALTAGARPCLRCRPQEGLSTPARRRTPAKPGTDEIPDGPGLAADVLRRLERSLVDGDVPPTDLELAGAHGVSERKLRAVVRAATGVTPRAWLAGRRAERLRDGLSARRPVLDAVLDAGYESPSAAYEAADAVLGMPPGRYQAGGVGERIRWTLASTIQGWALVAATDRGLCAVKLGDEPEALEAELRAEFDRAEVVRDDEHLRLPAAVVADLAAGLPRPEVATMPLDLAGTAFRRRVWEALRRIPAGETRTYREVAEALGAPKAARAVGSACAENPVSLVVPCHRVVGSDGAMHGYRWGLERKRRILQAERRRVAAGAPLRATAATPIRAGLETAEAIAATSGAAPSETTLGSPAPVG